MPYRISTKFIEDRLGGKTVLTYENPFKVTQQQSVILSEFKLKSLAFRKGGLYEATEWVEMCRT